MDKFALIGKPIGHSLSPELFSAAYAGKYAYALIEENDFPSCWEKAEKEGCRALNVTTPFKNDAAAKADWKSPEVERIGAANILLHDGNLVRAYNSDYLGIRLLLEDKMPGKKVAVIGYGGAGRAAATAVEDSGRDLILFRHDELGNGVKADVIIYTLPRPVDNCGKLEADIILEANYRNPSIEKKEGYISGKEWLLAQAITGYELMTGEKPDVNMMRKCPGLLF